MPWRPGDRILDLYEVLDEPLAGGMGLVYRVRHPGWDIDLAVKVPRPGRLSTEAHRARFEAEAGTWVGLGLHPHVVSCAYVRRVDGLPCVFAEWVAGGSLDHLVRAGRLHEGPDAPDGGFLARALDLAVQSAWGIDHAHRQGLIHQDVKPANIMVGLDRDWTAKVTDFGLAGARAAADGDTGTAVDASLGASFGGMTPAYCSPEQAEAAAGARVTLTRATDVWSWALCVWEMFAGRRPCRYGQAAREAFADYLAAGQTGPAAQPMPQGVVDLLRECFDVDPSTRPHSLADLATALVGTYADVLGVHYPRVPPSAAGLLAGSLSNQALSLLDLDRPAESEHLWRSAADVDPHHPAAVYNWALYRWRHGRITDEQVLGELQAAREIAGEDWRADHLLGLVHAERGDDEAARPLLAAAPTGPEVAEVAAAVARRGTEPGSRRLPGHRGAVAAVAVDHAGRVIVSGGADGSLRVWSPTGQPGVRELGADGAGAAVTALTVDRDGRAALVVREGDRVECWDLARAGCVRVPADQRAAVTAVALTAAGTAAIGYDNGRIEIRDTADGRLRRTLEHPPSTYQNLDAAGRILPEIRESPARVTVLGLSEDGAVAVSAAPGDGSVVVWEVDTGRWMHRLVKAADMRMTGVNQVALGGSGRYALLIGHQTRMVHLWETRPNRVRGPVPNNLNRHAEIVLSGDGERAVSVGLGTPDQPARVWDTVSGRCLRTVAMRTDGLPPELAGLVSPTCVAVSGDGALAVVGDEYGGLHVHRLPRPDLRAPWSYERPLAAGAVLAAEAQVRQRIAGAEALARQGRTADAAGEVRAARELVGFERHPQLRELWERLGRTAGERTAPLGIWQRYELRGGQFTFVAGLPPALSVDGDLAVTAGTDGLLRVWELRTGRQRHTFAERVGNTHTIVLSTDARFAVSADWVGTAHLWDLTTGRRRAELHGDQGAVRAVAMDGAGRYAVVGDAEGNLCLWNLQQSHLIRTMVAHRGPVWTVRLSDDGRYAASVGAEDATCRVWRTGTGRPVLTVPVGFGGRVPVRFTPDSRLLLVNSTGELTAWDVHTGRQRYAVPSRGDAMALSRDGRIGLVRAYGGSYARVVSAWEAATGRVVCTLDSEADVFDVSPDGRHAVTADADRTLRIWDVRTGRRLHTCDGHPEPVSSVAFTADGRSLVSTDNRPAIRRWELDWDYDFTG
ncbi:protein kinase domain-containing protein [Micromonospora sp. WMMD734]|uniref:protein kinase domain-containing protein n=1 Tax=Micromonospora sp. WMMD734 TaxID=3404129 RepID=UPI003B9224F7